MRIKKTLTFRFPRKKIATLLGNQKLLFGASRFVAIVIFLQVHKACWPQSTSALILFGSLVVFATLCFAKGLLCASFPEALIPVCGKSVTDFYCVRTFHLYFSSELSSPPFSGYMGPSSSPSQHAEFRCGVCEEGDQARFGGGS